MTALYKGLFVAGIIAAIAFYPVTVRMMDGVGGVTALSYYIAALLGLGVTLALVFITDYYTSKSFSPVQEIAKASETGHATNIIAGLAVGMQATAWPVIVIAAAILGSFWICGGATWPSMRSARSRITQAASLRWRTSARMSGILRIPWMRSGIPPRQ
jgi:K(+)-stimulated pyrophosphate-energized sodium pump